MAKFKVEVEEDDGWFRWVSEVSEFLRGWKSRDAEGLFGSFVRALK